MKLKSLIIALITLFTCNVFASVPAPKPEGAVIGTMLVLNKNEINAADIVLKRNVNHDVRSFALMIQKGHTTNLQMWQSLSHQLNLKPVWSPTSRKLKAQGAALLAKLKPMNNRQFQIAYINAMVNGHAYALKLIDEKLLINAGNPTIVKDLKQTRAHVVDHLQKALYVKKQLMS